MKNEEAIKKLERHKAEYLDKFVDFSGITEALDAGIQALIQTKWTPVSEGLPEEYETVIASTEYGVYPEARYSKEDGWEWAYESGADYWEELDDVMAWMPLPKRYNPESKEENE